MATPCPHCAAAVPVPEGGGEGPCPACGAPLRFEAAPERPCDGCGEPLAAPPGSAVVTCGACGLLQAAEAGRGVRVEVRCPRCRRVLVVQPDDVRVTCRHCGADMLVEQA